MPKPCSPEQRKQFARKERLPRLVRLREMNAPRWVIKSEQVGLVLNRDGMKFAGIGKPCSSRQGDLMARHVCPLLGGSE